MKADGPIHPVWLATAAISTLYLLRIFQYPPAVLCRNPNGIESFSPRLRGSATLGLRSINFLPGTGCIARRGQWPFWMRDPVRAIHSSEWIISAPGSSFWMLANKRLHVRFAGSKEIKKIQALIIAGLANAEQDEVFLDPGGS